MFTKGYSVLPADERDCEINDEVSHRSTNSNRTRLGTLVSIAFVASLVFNVFAGYRLNQRSCASQSMTDRTQFAGLAWDVPSRINQSSDFNSLDREVEDAAWNSELVRPQVFAVALDDSYAAAQGLLHSQRWPWDSGKGVYVLNSGHELHCLHMLRDSVNDGADGVDPRWPRPHLMHCVEYLLQNIMCYADDTPLYTGYLHEGATAREPTAGLGTPRKCRDWNKLQAWAKERSACYKPHYGEGDPNITEADRYKFCPDGSKPWEHAQT